MKDYDELIDELGSKIEQRARMQQQIDLLLANVAVLDVDIERLRKLIDKLEESGGEY